MPEMTEIIFEMPQFEMPQFGMPQMDMPQFDFGMPQQNMWASPPMAQFGMPEFNRFNLF